MSHPNIDGNMANKAHKFEHNPLGHITYLNKLIHIKCCIYNIILRRINIFSLLFNIYTDSLLN